MAALDNVDGRLQGVEMEINYRFSDRSILSEARRAAGSVAFPASPSNDNRSLALVGDATMRMILVLHGYETDTSREMINKVVSTRSGNARLSGRGSHHALDRYIQRNPSQGTFVSHKLMASTVQAIIGAVYVDSDYDNVAVRRVMETLGLFWPEA